MIYKMEMDIRILLLIFEIIFLSFVVLIETLLDGLLLLPYLLDQGPELVPILLDLVVEVISFDVFEHALHLLFDVAKYLTSAGP